MTEVDGTAYGIFFVYALSTIILSSSAAYCLFEKIWMNSSLPKAQFPFLAWLSITAFGFMVSSLGVIAAFFIRISASQFISIGRVFHYVAVAWHITLMFVVYKYTWEFYPPVVPLAALYWSVLNITLGLLNPIGYFEANVVLLEDHSRFSLNEDKRNSMLALMARKQNIINIPLEFDN